MFKKISSIFVAGLMMLALGPVSVEAQSKKELQAAINQLNDHINTLYGMADDREKEERRVLADIAVSIGSIERQLRDLTGRIEQIEYQQEQINKRLDLLTADTQMRFEELKTADLQPPAETPAVGGDIVAEKKAEEAEEVPEMMLPEGTAATRYSWAYGYVRDNELDEAKEALRLVIDAHPKDAVAANAHYWLGRVHMLQKKPALAAQQFLIVFDSFPKHDKVPDALLELGTSLTLLDETEQACQAYMELERAYPNAKPRTKKRAKDAATKLSCS